MAHEQATCRYYSTQKKNTQDFVWTQFLLAFMLNGMDGQATDFLERLGNEVRSRRRDRGWSQEDLAGESGLHTNQISLVERGNVNASLAVTRRIAAALDMKLSELLVAVGE